MHVEKMKVERMEVNESCVEPGVTYSGARVIGVEDIARVCHEANRAYCAALGDFSQLAWDDAPQWQRDSCMAGVRFHCDNPNAAPESSHVEWMTNKASDGWVYGPVKDAERKEHPCMVPYDQLPPEQRAKDHIFIGVVKAMLHEPCGWPRVSTELPKPVVAAVEPEVKPAVEMTPEEAIREELLGEIAEALAEPEPEVKPEAEVVDMAEEVGEV